ncbi:TPA: lichenicidin A2 family type 2 lantibiotic, partial [Enterococcus faecalis]|nr:lichenicidin A2 family type 2 lantibiotic [Enterococcus faecalis]HDT8053777.1 lichenicidin A2 family type 2 lantibiotic [Enterococcus faecalis]HDV0801527.1 lichenicidin A2 family type 2 lantibiotic [Enterococcus faecalis]
MDEKQLDSLVGQKFEDLSKEEMNFIAGGNDNARISPTIILSAATVASAASSFVGSYT